jgi:hypothetical protein
MLPLILGNTYCLRLPNGQTLGHVRLEKKVDDWLEGPFTPTAAFEGFRLLFDREAELRYQQIIPLWEEARETIEALDIQVIGEGEETPHSQYRIFVEGNEAIVGAPLARVR